ncbi:TRAP transporter substrate-binding protein [Endozoicomonas sp. SM1973]|uniref:TRAP transporter substrate-binding protein n=1 Tax=Spartinivicinus marinus TaxID=2994442 RepID=A0A853HZY5_9GAMM|nr:TRAP transporter substrate-binding protein [Spartinivicinus marinus]MCX4029172.1 TRAP transporter substrate-binding protein [Spartinivicinus marinus]NYZ65919.1 TRAP transporter substrate-binding protein [Spartinivicinus marinus]
MKKLVKFAASASTTLMTTASLLIGSSSALAATKWDMPTPYADGIHHTKNVRMFAEEVKTLSKGELNIKVHSGASLFKHGEIHRAIRTGQVPIGELFMAMLGNHDEVFKLDNIPFLATDFESAKKLWDSSRPAVEKSLAKDGLKLLFAVPWPPQGIYSKKPVSAIGDLAKLKMRSYSPTLSRLSVLLKATPTTVQTPEIPQAFSTGIIDAMITSPSTGVSSQAWDYVSYYNDAQAWIPKNMVIVHNRSFKRLPKAVQAVVMKAAADAEKRGWEMAQQETQAKTEALAKNGIKVSKPDAQLQADLAKLGEIMTKEWAKAAGDRAKQILDAYNK